MRYNNIIPIPVIKHEDVNLSWLASCRNVVNRTANFSVTTLERQCTYSGKSETGVFNHCCSGKSILYIILIIKSYNKPTRLTNSQIYFWNETLYVSNSSSVHHQGFFTVHRANLCDIYHYCVYSEKLVKMDRGTVRNM